MFQHFDISINCILFLGHVEADNESEIDAALRETREETGLNVMADYDVYIQYKVYFDVRSYF